MPTVQATYPPGPKPKPLFGHLWNFRRDSIKFLTEMARDYGDIVYFTFGPQKVYLISNPDMIKETLVVQAKNFHKSRGLERAKRFLGEGLLTSEEEFHKRQRRLSQPAFHKQRIASYASVMVEYGARMREGWRDGSEVDMDQEMMRLTLAIAGKTLFDADVEDEAAEIGEALTTILQAFRLFILPFSEVLEMLPLPAFKRYEKARQRLDKTIFRMINERRKSGVDRGDLLSMLLLATDVEGDGTGMTDAQLRDEVMTLFLAGHETTANALTWTWYLLSQNPEAEAKLHKEIDEVLEGRLPAVDDIKNLKYAEMVFAESMRMYPPAWIIGRKAMRDCEIGGYVIPEGSFVFMSQYVVHHDERHFPDPYKFIPERWTHEAQASRPKFSYFPFGGGPRQCIGDQFAWMEGTLMISTLAQQWKMRHVEGHRVAMQPIITLRPKFGMKMTLHKR